MYLHRPHACAVQRSWDRPRLLQTVKVVLDRGTITVATVPGVTEWSQQAG